MSRWAPIIMAKTWQVDFRFIALPAFFSHDGNLQWANSYITDMRINREKLAAGPRLAIFQSDVIRVVGVTGLVRDLIGRHDPMIVDCDDRNLWAFIGYGTRRDESGLFPAVPSYASTFAVLAGLYYLVRAHWFDKRELPPQFIEPDVEQLVADWWICQPPEGELHGRDPSESLNGDPQQISLWPDSLHERAILWRRVSMCSTPTSLCLGFANQRDAKRTAFMNATVSDLTEGSVCIAKV